MADGAFNSAAETGERPVVAASFSNGVMIEPKMPITDRLGAFEVRGLLASGSMGEVYEAVDPRLGRTVAIKVLAAEVTRDAGWMQRLEDEARTLARINHPNVAAIHGLERDGPGGAAMLVLEFVPGPTLSEHLSSGRMRIEEALRLGVQIASGLEAAHELGIIHRDLKPDNIKIAPRVGAKILDFGVSLRCAERVHPPGADAPPDLSGTHGYISPEQYRGLPVDKRADIFAFGCVMFECLTGRQCFRGAAAEEVMLATLDDEPEWHLLPARTPRRVLELLAKCLQKDPQQRLRDIGDARLDLELAFSDREWTGTREAVRTLGPVALVVGSLIAGGALMAVGLKWWGGAAGNRSSTVSPINVTISEPGSPVCGSMYNTGLVSISPDGNRVVYAVPGPTGNCRLMLWESERGIARPLPGEGVFQYDPCFTPDGRSVLFADPAIRRVDGADGSARTIWTGASVMKGMAVLGADVIFSPHATSGLMSVPISGGRPPLHLTVPDYESGELSHRYPDPLPDGRHVLFTLKRREMTTFDDAMICVLDTRTGTWRRVLQGGSFGRYSPTGHLLYVCAGTLFAVPFDLRTLTLTGVRVPVVEGVMHEPTSGAAQYALSREGGRLAYIPGGPAEEAKELCWMGPGESVEPLGAPLREYLEMCPSPDGERIAAVVSGASDSVFIHEKGRGTLMRLTFGGNAKSVCWSPDSRSVYYASDATGSWAMYRTPGDGSGAHERLVELPGLPGVAACELVEGSLRVVVAIGGDLFEFSPDVEEENRQLNPVLDTGAHESDPSLSPDGARLAYTSTSAENGRPEVFVRPFPLRGEPAQRISFSGGALPRWSPDGSRLLFEHRRSDGRVEVQAVETAQLDGRPTPRLHFAARGDLFVTAYAAPDGRRVLGLRAAPPTYRADRVCLILNFGELLKSKMNRVSASR